MNNSNNNNNGILSTCQNLIHVAKDAIIHQMAGGEKTEETIGLCPENVNNHKQRTGLPLPFWQPQLPARRSSSMEYQLAALDSDDEDEIKDEHTNDECKDDDNEMENIPLDGNNPAIRTNQEEEEDDMGCDVVDQTRHILQNFEGYLVRMYPEASCLCETAIALLVETKAHWREGTQRVQRGEWSPEQFDRDLDLLVQQRQTTWDRLLALSAEMVTEVKQEYAVVQSAHEQILRAKQQQAPLGWSWLLLRRDHATAPPMQHQKELAHIYRVQLKRAFAQVQREVDGLIAYPDGSLTKIRRIATLVQRETETLSRQLKEENSRRYTKVVEAVETNHQEVEL